MPIRAYDKSARMGIKKINDGASRNGPVVHSVMPIRACDKSARMGIKKINDGTSCNGPVVRFCYAHSGRVINVALVAKKIGSDRNRSRSTY